MRQGQTVCSPVLNRVALFLVAAYLEAVTVSHVMPPPPYTHFQSTIRKWLDHAGVCHEVQILSFRRKIPFYVSSAQLGQDIPPHMQYSK